jgi:hypothetical protein
MNKKKEPLIGDIIFWKIQGKIQWAFISGVGIETPDGREKDLIKVQRLNDLPLYYPNPVRTVFCSLQEIEAGYYILYNPVAHSHLLQSDGVQQ